MSRLVLLFSLTACGSANDIAPTAPDGPIGETLTPIPSDGRRVFKSSEQFSGDFSDLSQTAVCEELAALAGLPGTYAAITTSQGKRALSEGGPLFLPAGGQAFQTLLDTPPFQLLRPIDQNEFGAPQNTGYWSDMRFDLQPSSETCNGWTTTEGRARVGSGRGDSWADADFRDCADSLSVLCIQYE